MLNGVKATKELLNALDSVKKPPTNADRIRSMTDEELVVFLDEFSSRCINCVEDVKNQSCPIYKEGYYCRPQDIMGWLQQPAEKPEEEGT